MTFKLNHEKATDVLLWWVEGADGSIDYREEEAVANILEEMDYSLETFYQETFSYIGALSTEHIKDLVDDAVEWADEHFSDQRKKLTIILLERVASCTGEITKEQREKIDRVKKQFGM